jgi:hypothetical protein
LPRFISAGTIIRKWKSARKTPVEKSIENIDNAFGEYNLLFFNREHFARWCATGELESEQVKRGAVIAGALVAKAAGWGEGYLIQLVYNGV